MVPKVARQGHLCSRIRMLASRAISTVPKNRAIINALDLQAFLNLCKKNCIASAYTFKLKKNNLCPASTFMRIFNTSVTHVQSFKLFLSKNVWPVKSSVLIINIFQTCGQSFKLIHYKLQIKFSTSLQHHITKQNHMIQKPKLESLLFQ